MSTWQLVRRYKYTLTVVLLLCLVFVPLMLRSFDKRAECEGNGGVYVRGMWGYVCAGDGNNPGRDS